MAKDIWNDNDGSFVQMPDEVYQDQAVLNSSVPYQPIAQHRPAPATVVQEFQDLTSQETDELVESLNEGDAEDDFAAVLSDASLRLEQGNLYKIIMNNNIFEGMDADQKAVNNVQREIRRFAKERMEIMLGMRQIAVPGTDSPKSPFNNLEVEILKKLASKATNGATESEEANQVAEVIKEPKKQTLTPIKLNKPTVTKPSLSKPTRSAPVTKNPVPAVKNNEPAPLKKNPADMTGDELLEANKRTLEKYKKADNPNRMPMPSPQQQEMMAIAQVQNINAGGMSGNPNVSALMGKIITHFTK